VDHDLPDRLRGFGHCLPAAVDPRRPALRKAPRLVGELLAGDHGRTPHLHPRRGGRDSLPAAPGLRGLRLRRRHVPQSRHPGGRHGLRRAAHGQAPGGPVLELLGHGGQVRGAASRPRSSRSWPSRSPCASPSPSGATGRSRKAS
jgi:hypothetical protein